MYVFMFRRPQKPNLSETMEPRLMKLVGSSAILAFLLPTLLATTSSSIPGDFPAIFNLGASNSDTGGFSASFGPLPSPYGENFFGRPAGRYSDGRIILDFIAEGFGLPRLSAYLDSIATNFSRGANFASAGATIIPQNSTLAQGGYSPFSLDVQLRQFMQFKQRSQIAYNNGGIFKDLMPKEECFSKALYTFDIGQDDLTALFFGNNSADEYIPSAMKQFSSVIKSIYEQGGRHFWIHNTGPLGCLPCCLVRVPPTSPELDSIGCAVVFNQLAQKFNGILIDTINQLRFELPLATFTYVDIYAAKYLLISHAQKFGFDRPLKACCGYGGGEYNFDLRYTCGVPHMVNGTLIIAKSCREAAKRVSWDGTHYTDAANKWVFDQLATGKFLHPPNYHLRVHPGSAVP